MFGLPVLASPFLSIFIALHTSAPDLKGMPERRTEVSIKGCGALKKANTIYVLQNDVSAAGTCFSIEADGVKLDLGQHTVTYGVSDGAKPVFGVLAADCWYKPIAGNPCGGTHRQIEITNGKIVQGSAAAPFSHAIRLGQASNISGASMHGLDITVSAEDSFGIYGEYLPGGSDIHDNVIHNKVKIVSNRSQFRGASIKLDGESGAKLPDLIHKNVIIGGAQLGIRDDNQAGTKIYENDISQDATYANGFCIDAAGNGMQVYRNNCHPVHGRGIHANHSNVQIFDNMIETVDSNQIQEYGGCEIHGTYGIQLENDEFNPRDIHVFGNHVVVHAGLCPAAAMRFTDLNGSDIHVYGNTFIAVQDKVDREYSTQDADGVSFGNVIGSQLRFHDNLVQADSAIFYIDWDGGNHITLDQNTFQAGRKGQATLAADFETGAAPAHDNYLVDNTYEGLSASSVRFGPYAADSWYEVLNSVRLSVTAKAGTLPEHLSGIALAGTDKPSHEASSDKRGIMTFLLPEVLIENKRPPINYPTYDVTLRAQACRDDAFRLTPVKQPTVTRQMICR